MINTQEVKIISKEGMYCGNPETHILGSLPCCKGLFINSDMVDPKDIRDERKICRE